MKSSSAFRRALVAKGLVLAAVVGFPLMFLGRYAGDAEIHLVYASNAAAGRFFEFNPGEKAPGVTSAGYMLFLALLFRVLDDSAVPAVVIAINYAAWYGLIWLVFVLARRLCRQEGWPWVAALIAGVLPGSVHNSTNGMENGLFALLVFLWTYLALRWRWFDSSAATKPWEDAVLGLLMGLGFWTRPEGFVVFGIAFLLRFLPQCRSAKRLLLQARRSAAGLAVAFLLGAGVICFHYWQTGHLLPGSARARRILAMTEAWDLGVVGLHARLLTRLVIYFPLTAFSALGVCLLIKRRDEAPRRALVAFLVSIVVAFLFAYTFVLGCLHTARYVIFMMPCLILPAVWAMEWLWSAWRRPKGGRHVLFAAGGLFLAAVFGVETALRLRMGSPEGLYAAMRAPKERAAYSEQLLKDLGNPRRFPVVLAMHEVQIRYWLDARFVVRSLDGRVDPVLLDYYGGGAFDYTGYLKARKVDFLLEVPEYKALGWNPGELEALENGQSLVVRGLRFTRLARSTFKLQREED